MIGCTTSLEDGSVHVLCINPFEIHSYVNDHLQFNNYCIVNLYSIVPTFNNMDIFQELYKVGKFLFPPFINPHQYVFKVDHLISLSRSTCSPCIGSPPTITSLGNRSSDNSNTNGSGITSLAVFVPVYNMLFLVDVCLGKRAKGGITNNLVGSSNNSDYWYALRVLQLPVFPSVK